MKIRTAGKALIIENNKILLIKHQTDQVYYTLPGGGQHHNEPIKVCVKRECLEEIGYKVGVEDLIFVYEYIGDLENHFIKGYHQIDMIFNCQLKEFIKEPTEMDQTQIGFEWVDLKSLMNCILYPMSLREKILESTKDNKPQIYFSNLL